MPRLPDAAVLHDTALRRISAAALLQARRLWAQLGEAGSFDAAWATVGPRLLVLLTAAQLAAARDGAAYVPLVIAELGLPPQSQGNVSAASFAGVASDGRDLATLLYEPVIAAKFAIGSAPSVADALQSGQGLLDRIVTTQIADADREATQVATVARTGVTGYVRMVNAPCCGRCAVLAGRFYRWNAGFQRHPQCDCRHIPATENVAGDMRTDPRALADAGQIKDLSKADAKAIADGADPAQVINAQSGMYTAAGGVKATFVGTSKRALAGQRLRAATGRNKVVRLRPEAIYKLAGDDRELAVKLLRQHGFII